MCQPVLTAEFISAFCYLQLNLHPQFGFEFFCVWIVCVDPNIWCEFHVKSPIRKIFNDKILKLVFLRCKYSGFCKFYDLIRFYAVYIKCVLSRTGGGCGSDVIYKSSKDKPTPTLSTQNA